MDARLQKRVQRCGWDKAAAHHERSWQAQLEPAESAPAGEVLGTDARKEAAEILRGLIERITVRDDPNGHRVELTVVIL